VSARAHPGVLGACTFLNSLYAPAADAPADTLGADLRTPLVYADRFRLRKPGVQWDAHPPHVDGGTIERWQADSLRACFDAILQGNWREHDPYELGARVRGRSSLYGRPNQSSVFRTFQGWLALRYAPHVCRDADARADARARSDTAPGEGTIQFFPDVALSNAYLILRPFFRLKPGASDPLPAGNWELDLDSPDFPGIAPRDGGFIGPRPTPASHPHLDLERAMVSVPKVAPGDMVFWHCVRARPPPRTWP
jgi:hypothetical protein